MRKHQRNHRFESDSSKLVVVMLIVMVSFIAGSLGSEVTSAADIESVKAPADVSPQNYLQMAEDEKSRYIARRAPEVVRAMGLSGEEATPAAIDRIKQSVDLFASRLNSQVKSSCGFNDDLQTTFERARTNAPFIIAAFNAQKVDPRIGLYLAMVESAHCSCIQSPTGTLGLYQLSRAEARRHGLNAFAEASTLQPDDRCGPHSAATAAAKQLKATSQRFVTSDLRLSLAIVAFDDREAFKFEPDEFWTLVSNGERFLKYSGQSRVLPKFIAAAIVGENPKDFGLDMRPLSTYSK